LNNQTEFLLFKGTQKVAREKNMRKKVTAPTTPKRTLTTSAHLAKLTEGKIEIPPITELIDLSLHDVHGAWEILEDRRKAIPKGHGMRSDVVDITKLGIKLLRAERNKLWPKLKSKAEDLGVEIIFTEDGIVNDETLIAIEDVAKERRDLLKTFPIRPTLHEALICEAEQELVEYAYTWPLYRFLIEGRELEALPDFVSDLGVTLEAYLAGLGDVPGELGKQMNTYIISKFLPRPTRIAMRKAFLDIAEEIFEVLDEFENAVPTTINASSQRGYTYRFTVLGRVKSEIGRHQELLLHDMAGARD
jgi:predicted translin family RNA/ssDNA-binding protein